MEKNGNGNTVLLTVIGVATLLVALVGATFAYFTATVTGDEQQVSVQAKAPGSLQYTNTDEVLQIVNATPGKSNTQTFAIVNGDENNIHSYDLSLVIQANSFSADEADGGAGQLMLTFAAESTVTDGAVKHDPTILDAVKDGYDATGKDPQTVKLIEDVQISPNGKETHTYTATVKFVETGTNQTNNNDAAFSGHFLVDDDRTVAPTA